MYKFGAQILLILGILSSPVLAQNLKEPYLASDSDMLLLYYMSSGQPVDFEEVASNYPEYKNAVNEAARQNVVTQLTPVIQAQIDKLAKQPSYYIWFDIMVDNYDSAKGYFPWDFAEYKSFDLDRLNVPETLVFTNSQSFLDWPVSPQEAKSIAPFLNGPAGNKTVKAALEFRVTKSFPRIENGHTLYFMEAELTGISLYNNTTNQKKLLGRVQAH